MSWHEFMCKFAFTVRLMMEAPVGSPEREEWTRIKRELEKERTAALTTVQ